MPTLVLFYLYINVKVTNIHEVADKKYRYIKNIFVWAILKQNFRNKGNNGINTYC